MTTVELARLVNAMRTAQRKYFRTRGQGDLEESKRLERQVDDAIRDIHVQPVLPFGGD